MVRARKELPDANELVIATVKEIFDYGAYVELDEYNGMRAFLPWSEVATKWVKNIKEVLKENEKIVVKVIRVNKQKKQVDVSLKRVYDSEKKKKMHWYKRNQRAEKILELAAQKLGKTLDDAYNDIGWPLLDHYSDLYTALETAVMLGPDTLRVPNAKEEWIMPVYEEANKHIKIKQVKVTRIINLWSTSPSGIEDIRSVLLNMKNISEDNSSVNIYTIGAPKYKIEVISEDYKSAERIINSILEKAEKDAQKLKVNFEVVKEKE
ncbi:translation initiation factor IF-2 subunit alpha [Fervidicoccus fontis]|uniref:Translation initiation factor IF-2 subunit alpha n=2 Tax=Fervidicoccus fontis TaxID=683846 RepID=I0A271_FERFK|nr:translation initiation factor IF-2 subunit alpha [Fervidicoccus fontis]AFH43078.1 translation initiation factor IF-2 subunit alpha [Fervidicoccus fontis Kam940]MBE9391368.1 translation initiation factor IF-2 subunit alpha [Fervidicoccus fontis]PMB75611.1 MAG: bifunctional 4-hydroxy-3-methylbut-2-enyl diphosphate reductase/30S ribosomal protein S1 [Fervidicoccus fontis]HEW64108.1 translation initiation factor IF-2 subunit alpha [Fervidicoccus fontis]